MKEVTLASGRKLVIAPLTVKQGRQMSELVDQGQVATAAVGACVASHKKPTRLELALLPSESVDQLRRCGSSDGKRATTSNEDFSVTIS